MTENTSESLGKSLARGAAWMVSSRLVIRVIGFLSTLVLARLLLPNDFGIVALATAVLGLLEVLSEFRLDIALIQNQNATPDHYHTAWTMGLIRAAFIALLLLLGTNLTESIFDEPRMGDVMYVLALVAFLDGLQSVNTVNFRKDLQFHKEFIFLILPKIVSFVVTIICAVAWRDYWALVVGMLSHRTITVVSSYIVAPYRPRITLVSHRDILSFSVWLWAVSMLGFFARKIDTLLLGTQVSKTEVGQYHIAQEIATLPSSDLASPIARALFPGFAKVAHNTPRLRELYLQTVQGVTLLVFPAAIGLSLIAEPAVALLLGDKWLPIIPLVQIMAAYGALEVIVSGLPTVYTAMGRTRLAFIHSFIIGGIRIALLTTGVLWHGAIGAAWAVLASGFINVVVGFLIGSKILGFRFGRFFRLLLPNALALSTMSLVVIWFLQYPAANTAAIFRLLGGTCVGAIVYTLATYGLWLLRGRPEDIVHKLNHLLLTRIRTIAPTSR